MSNEADLIRALLGVPDAADEDVQFVKERAAALGVDVLDYCTHTMGVGATAVAARAAAWAGVATLPAVPADACYPRHFDRLDHLGEARTFRARLDGVETVYCAPRFIGLLALKDHFAREPLARSSFVLVPPSAIRAAYAVVAADDLIESARHRLTLQWPKASGAVVLGQAARTIFIVALVAVLTVAVVAPFLYPALFVPIVGLLLIVPASMKLLAAMLPPPMITDGPPLLSDEDLPVYSVLVPLRDEAQMVPQLRRALEAIDYPAEKLDIKFVVEERSEKTVAAVELVLDDPRFELVRVPDCMPRTKPKALNYALPLVRGAHVVVYDAEDVPDPDQLRKAASAFAADHSIDCLQAELVIDNASETLLTALFAGEYAGQFGLMLPLLSRWRLPMPLGGTSNHFLTCSLREVAGWDAFNVTEDADLGVRLGRLRYRTATLDSRTREEAPLTLKAWMAQRTRWMKGWMQTFIVHNRSAFESLSDMGWIAFLAFEIYVGSMVVSALLHTVFLTSLLVSLLTTGLALPDNAWGLASAGILAVGYGGAFAVVIVGLRRLGQQRILIHQLALPLYWMLHTVAAARAAYELFARPHYWAKTAHGRTKMTRRIAGASKPDHRRVPAPHERVEPVFGPVPGK